MESVAVIKTSTLFFSVSCNFLDKKAIKGVKIYLYVNQG